MPILNRWARGVEPANEGSAMIDSASSMLSLPAIHCRRC